MHRLAILKFCRDELAERRRNDPWQGWFWGIRRKVVNYWVSVLERDPDPADFVPELDPEERQTVRRSHALLAARPLAPATMLNLDRDWQVELHSRVEAYMAALKAHR